MILEYDVLILNSSGNRMIKVPAIFILVAAVALILTGCVAPASTPSVSNPNPEHNSMNSLDWSGAYYGKLPCADCEGIETVIVVVNDGRYRMWYRYLGKSDKVIPQQGQFSWNKAGNIITFLDSHVQYFVGENQLVRLAQDGSRITGPMAEAHVLTKFPDNITGRYWKLIELNGKPVPLLDHEPYLIFEDEGGRLTGFGGCNSFGGAFELDEAASHIRFGQIFSTLMACPSGMDIENDFHDVLRTVDNYTFSGDRLMLNQAQTVLAQFEVIYLR